LRVATASDSNYLIADLRGATAVAGLDNRAAASRNAGRKSGRCNTPQGGKGHVRAILTRPSASARGVIKAGIAAGVTALVPWHGVRAELPPVARNRTMILVGRA
jgi:hypothetical protein